MELNAIVPQVTCVQTHDTRDWRCVCYKPTTLNLSTRKPNEKPTLINFTNIF